MTGDPADALRYFQESNVADVRDGMKNVLDSVMDDLEAVDELLGIAYEIDCDQGTLGFDTNEDGDIVAKATVAYIDGAVESLIRHERTSEVLIRYDEEHQWYKVELVIDALLPWLYLREER